MLKNRFSPISPLSFNQLKGKLTISRLLNQYFRYLYEMRKTTHIDNSSSKKEDWGLLLLML
jgi:hypothetical protein